MPAYNARRWIGESVRSVQAQTYSEWELVIVDDGSSDDTGSLCDLYSSQDARIRCIHQEKQGPSVARNVGISNSEGEWIAFLDSDDVLDRRFLEISIKRASESGAQIIESGIKEFRGNYIESEGDIGGYNLDPYIAIREMWLQRGGVTTSPCGKLFHRNIFRDERFTPGIRYEDLDAMYRFFACSNQISVLRGRLYGYRQHEESFVHRFSRSRLDVLTVTDRLVRWAITEDRKIREGTGGISLRNSLTSAAWDRQMSANFNMFLVVERAIGQGEISVTEGEEIQARCFATIRRLRLNSLLGSGVRIKNRLGALLSYLGPRFLKAIANLVQSR